MLGATIIGSRERAALLALAVLALALALRAPGFFLPDNLRDVTVANAAVLIVAAGMTLVILTGEVDVSVGAVFGLCAVVAGTLVRDGIAVPIAVLAAVTVGGAIGLVNGLLVGWLGLPSIVVTLAMLAIVRDGLRWATEGAWVRDLPATFQWFGFSQQAGQVVVCGGALASAAAVAWLLSRTVAGRAVYATGSHRESARVVGLEPTWVIVSVFVATGLLTAVAAVLNAIRFAEVPGAIVGGLELKVIAAVIVGGAAITGGRGSMIGTVIGVALLGTIGTGLTFLGISADWERAVQGGIILAAIAFDRLGRRRAASHRRTPGGAVRSDALGVTGTTA
jgi:rhamnose transport system permease protein